jgi:predicted RNA polymerase sigma factor
MRDLHGVESQAVLAAFGGEPRQALLHDWHVRVGEERATLVPKLGKECDARAICNRAIELVLHRCVHFLVETLIGRILPRAPVTLVTA